MRRESLEPVFEELRKLSPEELPRFIADLEELRVAALARLYSPPPPQMPDEWLDLEAARAKLGGTISRDFMYRNQEKLGAKHMGRRLLFSSRALERYLNLG